MNAVQTRKIPVGAGKAEKTIEQLVDLSKTYFVTGLFIISKDEIESGDPSGVIERIGPETSPDQLRTMAGATLFAVDGYGDQDEEIFEIPEIRHFFRVHCRLWSPWVFAGTIFSPDLLALVLACLPSVSCLRREGELTVAWNTEEMQLFLEQSLPTAAWLHSRAGVDKDEGCLLLKAAAAYLGLPFNRRAA